MGPIDLYSREKKNTISQWGPSTVWLLTLFKISSFVFTAQERNAYRFETT